MSGLPVCRYGPSCYRKNPQHFAEFAHPWKDGNNKTQSGQGNNASPPASLSVRDVSPPPPKRVHHDAAPSARSIPAPSAPARQDLARQASPPPPRDITPTLPRTALVPAPNTAPVPTAHVHVPVAPVVSSSRAPPTVVNSAPAPVPAPPASSSSVQAPHLEGSGPFSLCLYPLGTEMGGFSNEDSASAAASALSAVPIPGPHSVFFVVPETDSACHDAFRHALPPSIDVVHANIAHIGRPAAAVACETTWRHKLSVSPTSRTIAVRAGESLAKGASQLAIPGTVGTATSIVLDASSSTMRREDGVQHVILIVAPNFSNDQRPDRIASAPTDTKARAAGLEKLQASYAAVLRNFVAATSATDNAKPSSHGGGWAAGLLTYVRNPEQHPTAVLRYDAEMVSIKDAYPKARHHYLILPRGTVPNSASGLGREHLGLLRRLKQEADWLSERVDGGTVKVGFHAAPSMHHLHVHVISDDFDAPGLQTKKHYLSFASAFFIPLDRVIADIEARGSAAIPRDPESLLDGPLWCHKCSHVARNMPDLKTHLATHR